MIVVKRYIKKPVIVEALQVSGDAYTPEVQDFCPSFAYLDSGLGFTIRSREGDVKGRYGDWIIKGDEKDGEFLFWINALDRFAENYEEVKGCVL